MKVVTITLRAKATIDTIKIHDPVWFISFSEKPNTLTQMTLDAKTGEILYRGEPKRIMK